MLWCSVKTLCMKKIYAFLLLVIYVSCFVLPLQAEADSCDHDAISYVTSYPADADNNPCSSNCSKVKTGVADEHFSHYTQHPAKPCSVKYCKSLTSFSETVIGSSNVNTPACVWRGSHFTAKVPLHILHCSFLI